MNERLKRLVTVLCFSTMAIVVLVILVPALLGYQRYVITGGSMTGTIMKGSVVYSKLTPVEQLKVGDIITFVPPGMSGAVTHRVIAIETGQDGRPVFSTKGDYNKVADPWQINFEQPRQARYAFHIPLIGYALAGLAIRQVRLILIGLPAVVIAVSLLWSLWARAGDEVRRQEAEEAATETAGEVAKAGAEA